MEFNIYDPNADTVGTIKFYPDMTNSPLVNADALLVPSKLLGLNPVGLTTVAPGGVDLESDPLKITYLATCSDTGAGDWTVTSLKVTNVTTGLSYTFGFDPNTGLSDGKLAQTFNYPYTSMFYSQQLGANGQAVYVGRSSGMIFRYGRIVKDLDGDGLNQAYEVSIGTSDGAKDTDGDGYDDNVEVLAGTDPLNPLSFPAPTSVAAPVITSYTFTGGNTVNLTFTGTENIAYKLTRSDTLGAFGVVTPTTGSTTTNGSGIGTMTYVVPTPVPAKSFFRIETP